jgi:gas vesicle protein
MDDRSAILMGALVGALAGSAVGYLYFTASGRRMREQFEPRMNEVIAELQRARSAAVRAVDAAGEGWDSVRHMQSTLRSRQVATETPIL